MDADSFICRLWEQGQFHLAAGRYAAARHMLERASDWAVRKGDLPSLARLYLPLLEARRLMRYRAAEGQIWVIDGRDGSAARRRMRQFERTKEGTAVIACAPRNARAALRMARGVEMAARRRGSCLAALLVLAHGREIRTASPAAPTFAAGVGVRWTHDPEAAPGKATDPQLVLPLPPPGEYAGTSGLGSVARESLLIAWEALALRWQARHPLQASAGPWEELLWLRAALRIDPACEPVTMRLMAVAEGMLRQAR